MGKINVYRCDKGHKTITIDKDEGVTPFMLLCRADGCTEMAMSQFYRVDQNQTPTHEWYTPNDDDVKREMKDMLDAGTIKKKDYDRAWRNFKEHVSKGGLLLRKIETF